VFLSKLTRKLEKHAQEDLFLAVKGLLAETVAFRKHFHITEMNGIFS
jgi:hypothetical protein